MPCLWDFQYLHCVLSFPNNIPLDITSMVLKFKFQGAYHVSSKQDFQVRNNSVLILNVKVIRRLEVHYKLLKILGP